MGETLNLKGVMKLLAYVFAPIRLIIFFLYVCSGLIITLGLFRFMGWPLRQRIIKAWSRGLLMVLNVRLNVVVPPAQLPMRGMLVGNHSSWMDIFVANAVQPVRFIAKSEIRSWPLIGTLVTSVGTLYVERGNRHAISATNKEISDAAKNGDLVGLYPEGTTTDGTYLLPFKSNLFQPAIDNAMQIYPVGVTYTQKGAYAARASYAGDTSLLTSFWWFASSGGIVANLCYGPIIPAEQFVTRQELTRAAEAAVARVTGQTVVTSDVLAQVMTGG